MLRELRVHQLALVESARVVFGPGLNLLTGETGSGKSLIVDALSLALGGRASLDQVRRGADRALVEAVFETTQGELILRREVGRRSAAAIDGRAASPAQLRELGRALVGIHGQHEHQLLLDTGAQTLMLDAFAGALAAREATASAHADWAAAAVRLADLERTLARGKREEEYLRWQLQELRSAGLRLGEDEELTAERTAARHAVRLRALLEAAAEALGNEEGLPSALAGLRAAAELDSRLGEAARRLAALGEEAADLALELRRHADRVEVDPQRLEEIESRLALLDQIKRKYGGSLEAAIAERDRLESQLGQGADLEEAVATAQRDLSAARERLEAAAGALRRIRRDAAAQLAAAVSAELAGLHLEGAAFEVRLVPRTEIGPEGAELAEMLFSANPGEPVAPLARVASGGELSRVMLALRTAAAEADRLPTLVFDEVDAGIGGEAARQVGLRLKRLGARRQVLVVTHLAQIACFADRHLLVEKVADSQGRSVVNVRELSTGEERACELARMMSGAITAKALARARELIEEAAV